MKRINRKKEEEGGGRRRKEAEEVDLINVANTNNQLLERKTCLSF